MTVTDELTARAETYAATFHAGSLPLPPARHVAVVPQARLNPYGLSRPCEGDAHVIRSAGLRGVH